MKKEKIFIVIMCFGLFFCLINEAAAIYITDVNIVPDDPNEKDVITILVSGLSPQAYSTVESSDLSIIGTSLQLDLFIGVGIADIVSSWSHSEEIGTLPPGTYTLTIRTFYFPTGDLKDTHTIEFTVLPEPVSAEIDIKPDSLNLQSKGKWLTCYIWLPDDYSVADIEPNSVVLESEPNDIEPEWLWFEDEEEVAMAKFSRSDVQELLSVGEVGLTISGELTDGTKFEGTDVIKVIDKGGLRKGRVNSNSKVIDGIEYYVQTDKSIYKLGEQVQMLYRVTNLGGEDVTFGYFSLPEWNFWAEKDGEVIWRAVNRWYGVIIEFTLSPGESKEFPHYDHPYIWNMLDNENNLVNVGKYNVIGGLYAGSGAYDYTKVAVPIKIVGKPAD